MFMKIEKLIIHHVMKCIIDEKNIQNSMNIYKILYSLSNSKPVKQVTVQHPWHHNPETYKYSLIQPLNIEDRKVRWVQLRAAILMHCSPARIPSLVGRLAVFKKESKTRLAWNTGGNARIPRSRARANAPWTHDSHCSTATVGQIQTCHGQQWCKGINDSNVRNKKLLIKCTIS